jgi:hypothetical protein
VNERAVWRRAADRARRADRTDQQQEIACEAILV